MSTTRFKPAGKWGQLCIMGALVLAMTCSAPAQKATWIDEVSRWEDTLRPDQQQTLTNPLSIDATRPQPATYISMEAWQNDRPRWLERWREWLGPMPPVHTTPSIEWLDSETVDGIVRRHLRIEVEPGVFMDAVSLRPDQPSLGPRSLPGIVALHPTTSNHLAEISGALGESPRAIGWHFAKRGYAVLCPKCFLWQDTVDFSTAVERHQARHPQALGMAKMLFDAQRAVDALVSLDGVDPNRIAAIGHSLGAKQVLYLMAFDSRIAVGVASEGGLAFESTNWDAPWYLGPSVRDPTARPWHPAQLLALIAPRPLLILGGEQGPGAADGSPSMPAMSAAAPLWHLLSDSPKGKPLRLAIWNHRLGHVFDQIQLDRSAEWIDAWNTAERSQPAAPIHCSPNERP